jgi:hypothetical protein
MSFRPFRTGDFCAFVFIIKRFLVSLSYFDVCCGKLSGSPISICSISLLPQVLQGSTRYKCNASKVGILPVCPLIRQKLGVSTESIFRETQRLLAAHGTALGTVAVRKNNLFYRLRDSLHRSHPKLILTWIAYVPHLCHDSAGLTMR